MKSRIEKLREESKKIFGTSRKGEPLVLIELNDLTWMLNQIEEMTDEKDIDYPCEP